MNIEKSLLTRLSETFDEYRTERRHNRVQEAGSKPVRAGRFLQWVVPNGGTLLLIIILVTTVRVWARPLINTTNVPGPSATTVNYQGRLANSDGTPLTEDGVAMSFAIYDAEEGGNLIWPPSGSEDHVVDVSDGLFSVGLGSKTSGGIPTTTWNGDCYLEITVGGETLAPRELIRSVPIAGMALTVPDGSITTAKLADGAVTASKAALPHGYIVGSSGTFALNTTYRTVPGLTLSVNPTTPQVLNLTVALDATTASNQTIVGHVFVNGSIRGRPIVLRGNSVRASVSVPVQVNLSPGSHTIEVRAKVESGTGSFLHSENSVMTYIMFSQ